MSRYNQGYFERNGISEEGGLYVVKLISEEEEFYKIGISSANSEYRLQQARLSHYLKYGFQVELLEFQKLTLFSAWQLEQSIIKLLSKFAYDPKQSFEGYTECFSKSPMSIFQDSPEKVIEAAKEQIDFWLQRYLETIKFLFLPNDSWRQCPFSIKIAKETLAQCRVINTFFIQRRGANPPIPVKKLIDFFKTQLEAYSNRAEAVFRAELKKRKDEISKLRKDAYQRYTNLKEGFTPVDIGGQIVPAPMDEESIKLNKEIIELEEKRISDQQQRIEKATDYMDSIKREHLNSTFFEFY